MTKAEKILARASGKSKVSPNQFVQAKVDLAMMPVGLPRVTSRLLKAGIQEKDIKIWDPEKFVIVLDHTVPPTTPLHSDHYKKSREEAKKYKMKYFYDVNNGIGHQIMHEKGHVKPGQLILGADSHTTTYGALNAAATGIGYSEMAYVMMTGEQLMMVPETIKFVVNGKLGDFVSAKDIILYIAHKYGEDMAQYKSIEWEGPVIDSMSLDGRFTMSNMSVELGAKFSLFNADQKTIDYIKSRTSADFETVKSDPDAVFAEIFSIDGSQLEPQVALPHSIQNAEDVSKVKGIKIDQAVISSCCHGRIDDLEAAARIVKGKKVHPDVRFYVTTASWEVYMSALDKGLIRTLVEAGVMIGYPSCGFCTGYHGILAPGEKCIAATPRNFQGRMGSPQSEIYLASPATVAASAIRGMITDPREVN